MVAGGYPTCWVPETHSVEHRCLLSSFLSCDPFSCSLPALSPPPPHSLPPTFCGREGLYGIQVLRYFIPTVMQDKCWKSAVSLDFFKPHSFAWIHLLLYVVLSLSRVGRGERRQLFIHRLIAQAQGGCCRRFIASGNKFLMSTSGSWIGEGMA